MDRPLALVAVVCRLIVYPQDACSFDDGLYQLGPPQSRAMGEHLAAEFQDLRILGTDRSLYALWGYSTPIALFPSARLMDHGVRSLLSFDAHPLKRPQITVI
jgi:hypothetical protein